MNNLSRQIQCLVLILLSLISITCRNKNVPSAQLINEINLKRGEVTTCGSPDRELGSVEFETSCGGSVKESFELALKLLHSFEYDEAEKVFASIIDENPACAMAYWGVAMSNFHPLWTPPTTAELIKGARAIRIAASIGEKSKREADYIDAISSFYQGYQQTDHQTRTIRFEKAMKKLHADYPGDKEATIFYALALDAAADPGDKSYSKQKQAGSLLNSLYPGEPNHPGIVHYIIHTYDSPELAKLALPAARNYASVAPSSAHAQHMPSHIFTRLGLWEESINSNLASIAAAQCYAESVRNKGHWDEELHGIDYLVYAYLQKGENDAAKKLWDYLNTFEEVNPVNFKVAYAYAAVPSRYLLENKLWKEAASLQIPHQNFPWKEFPWREGIIHFTRLLGSVHSNNKRSAINELKELKQIHAKLLEKKDAYKANQILIQVKASEAWMMFNEGKNDEAIKLMNLAADMEDKTEKHPVTPGEVIPARELLGDMFLQMEQPRKALEAYEATLKKQPNRFNALYQAGLAAQQSGNPEKAELYYRKLLTFSDPASASRPELALIRQFLKQSAAERIRISERTN
jgi:hypothetical protein